MSFAISPCGYYEFFASRKPVNLETVLLEDLNIARSFTVHWEPPKRLPLFILSRHGHYTISWEQSGSPSSRPEELPTLTFAPPFPRPLYEINVPVAVLVCEMCEIRELLRGITAARPR